MVQVALPVARTGSLRGWLIEVSPLACTIALVWAKLAYLSVLVSSERWAQETQIAQRGRPLLHVFDALQTYPYIVSATLASLLLLFAPILLVPRTRRLVALLALNLAFTLLGLADLWHVRFYADVLSSSSFTAVRMLDDIMPSLGFILRRTNPLYAADILLGLLLLPAYVRVCRWAPRLPSGSLRRLSAALVVAGLVLAIPTLRLAWGGDHGLFSYGSLRIQVASVTGLLPYHLLEPINSLGSGRTIGEPERERVRRFLDEERRRRDVPSDLFGVARGRNLILISAESLHAFPIGLEVRGQPVAPRLSAFAGESLAFANFHDQTYLGTTADAEFLALQSLHPQPVGFVVMDYADNDYRALPAILSDHGYSTLAAVAAPGDSWNWERLHPRYGFHRSLYEDDYAIAERIGPWLSDREFFRQTLPTLEGQAEPFLAFLLSSSNHHPYPLPDAYRALELGDLEGTLLGNYLQSVHYFDRAFGEFIDRLGETGLLDRSLIVLYGDHQGFLGDPPELVRLLGLPEWGEYHRFRVRKAVPLLIRLPHGAQAGVRDVVGGHLDIAPTVLSLLGVDDDNGVMLGRDLTQDRNAVVAFRDGSFADGRHYFIQRFGATFGATCYEVGAGRTLDCGLLEAGRREARERLEISDLIVRGNLIPTLRGDGASPARR